MIRLAREDARAAALAPRDEAPRRVSWARLRSLSPLMLKLLVAALAVAALAAIGLFAGAPAVAAAPAEVSPSGDAGPPLAEPVPPPPRREEPLAGRPCVGAPTRTRATPEDPVYLNDATAEDLRRLPGVGPKRAEAILRARAAKGRFSKLEELMRVKGVGRATLRKWRPLVRLERPVERDAGAAPG